jgi:hypothetical protein
MNREQIILSSTNVDKHGMMMTKESLVKSLDTLNSDRSVRLGLEHDMSLPPLGRITDAEVIEGKDGEHYLVAYKEFLNVRQQTILEDGSVLYKEYFENNSKPFVESKPQPNDIVEINADPVNFDGIEAYEEFMLDLKKESGEEFSNTMLIRKSHIPDPELVIKITSIIATSIGVIASKIPEKIGEAIGEDIAKFYKLLRVSVVNMVKKAIPKLRPITFIMEIHDEEVFIELLIVSNNPDEVINSFSPEKLKTIKTKIETSKNMFDAEKIQFTLNEYKDWELNYMLTKDGSVIGTKKAFDKRDLVFKELVKKLIEKNNSQDKGSC